jgi:aspartate/methionine/tyrosine aminotransferase
MRDPASYISHRAHGVDASGIRKAFDLAAKMKDPINLSIGLPDFDVPDAAKEAAIAAIRAGHNRYSQTQGIAPLRERLRKDLSTEMGRDVGEILVTSGVAGGLFLSILATIDPGEEVVFLDPYFVMYKHMVTMAGGKSIMVDSYPDFRFPAEKVDRAITSKTKVMILGSPGNPTGCVMDEADIRAAVALAKKHDLLIVSDEIYEPFLYDLARSKDGKRLYSAGALYEKTIILRGFSKSHAMTGWRLGYAAGPAEIIQQMMKLQQYTFICGPTPLQYGALAAIDTSMETNIAAYKKKRDLVFEVISKKFELTRPGGAFYAFPKAPAGLTASEFCAKAVEHNVLIIPGNVFSERDTHFRISYAMDDERLRKGCEILTSIS